MISPSKKRPDERSSELIQILSREVEPKTSPLKHAQKVQKLVRNHLITKNVSNPLQQTINTQVEEALKNERAQNAVTNAKRHLETLFPQIQKTFQALILEDELYIQKENFIEEMNEKPSAPLEDILTIFTKYLRIYLAYEEAIKTSHLEVTQSEPVVKSLESYGKLIQAQINTFKNLKSLPDLVVNLDLWVHAARGFTKLNTQEVLEKVCQTLHETQLELDGDVNELNLFTCKRDFIFFYFENTAQEKDLVERKFKSLLPENSEFVHFFQLSTEGLQSDPETTIEKAIKTFENEKKDPVILYQNFLLSCFFENMLSKPSKMLSVFTNQIQQNLLSLEPSLKEQINLEALIFKKNPEESFLSQILESIDELRMTDEIANILKTNSSDESLLAYCKLHSCLSSFITHEKTRDYSDFEKHQLGRVVQLENETQSCINAFKSKQRF